MPAKAPRRICLLIDRDFQFRYLLTWILMTMTLLSGLVLASITMFFLFRVKSANWLIMGNGVCAVVITLVSMRVMVKQSNRIAGPAFRLERTLRHLADGRDPGPVKLRRRDYMRGVADAVNHLREKQLERAQEFELLKIRAEGIEQSLAAGNAVHTQLQELIEDLESNFFHPEPIDEYAEVS